MKFSKTRRFAAGLAAAICLLLPGTASASDNLSGAAVTMTSSSVSSFASVANVQCEPDSGGMRCTIVLSDGTAKDVYIADP